MLRVDFHEMYTINRLQIREELIKCWNARLGDNWRLTPPEEPDISSSLLALLSSSEDVQHMKTVSSRGLTGLLCVPLHVRRPVKTTAKLQNQYHNHQQYSLFR